MSVRKNGRLVIKYAKDNHAKRFMREENRKIDQKEFRQQYEEEKEKLLKQFAGIGNANVKFICLSCGEKNQSQWM